MAIPRPVPIAYAFIAGMTALSGVVPPQRPVSSPPPAQTPAAQTPAAPQVDFASTTAEVIRFVGGKPMTTLLVKNDHGKSVNVSFRLALLNHQGAALNWTATPSPDKVESRRTVPITVTLVPEPALRSRWDKSLPARGQLILIATDGSPGGPEAVKLKEITVPQLLPPLFDLWVVLPGSLAALIVLCAGLVSSGRSVAISSGTPTWSPQSWSSNLAIGSAALASLLAVTALPAHTHFMDRSSYTVLSALFPVLVALAPSVYGLLRADGNPSPSAALKMFAFAAAVTVWATIGQLGTAILLLLELHAAQVISFWNAAVSSGIVGAAALLVAVYAVRAVRSYLGPAHAIPQDGASGPAAPPAASKALKLL